MILLQHLGTVQLCHLPDRKRKWWPGAAAGLRPPAFLAYLASLHDQDAICAGHGVDSVGDGEHGAVPEGCLDGVLDQSVRLRIDGRRGLVQEDDLWRRLACKGAMAAMEVLRYRCQDTLELRSRALVMHISCRSPTEKFWPFSSTGASSFWSSLEI